MQFVDLPDKFSDGPLIKPETSPQAYETATPACPSLLTAAALLFCLWFKRAPVEPTQSQDSINLQR
jgi:hypothetical protein